MPELFSPLKIIHILSAVVALGANVTYAFWLGRAGANRERLLDAIQGVRQLDARLANPAYVLVLISGIGMVLTGFYSFEQRWISAAIGLYAVTALLGILAFAPALRRQLVEAEKDPLSDAYRAAARRTTFFGALTTAVVAAIVVLMVSKPF